MNEAQRAVLDKALVVAGKRLAGERGGVLVRLGDAGLHRRRARSTDKTWIEAHGCGVGGAFNVAAYSWSDGQEYITVRLMRTRDAVRLFTTGVSFVSDFDMLVEAIVETWDATVAMAGGGMLTRWAVQLREGGAAEAIDRLHHSIENEERIAAQAVCHPQTFTMTKRTR